jgi:hypothetical protein
MGNRFIFLYHSNTFLATKGVFLTLRAKQSTLVCVFNLNNSSEKHNAEKENKSGNRGNLLPMPGALEKGKRKDFE